MSLLPGQILPPTEPLGTVNSNGTVTIDKNWWLLLYNLCLQILGPNTGIPSDPLINLLSADGDAIDADAIALRAPVSVASLYAQDAVDVRADLAVLRQALSNSLLLSQDVVDLGADVASLKQSVSNALLLAQDVLPQDPMETTGKFTGTLKENSGATTLGTGTCTWSRIGKHCLLQMPSIQATSAATDMTLTGIPGDIQPATLAAQVIPCALENNGNQIIGTALISPLSGTISFSAGPNGTVFTAAGQKGVIFPVLAYLLN